MRSREQDRQQWQDPDFNKWLDDAISDAGHTVWDAIPDVGSAWNGWDAAKAALGYYCPACNGSGEEIHVTYHGPDSSERLGHCTACNGDGRTSAALAVASERLVSETSHRGDLQAKVWGLQAEIDKLKAENEALRTDKDRIDALEANGWDIRNSSSPIADTGDYSNAIEIVGRWMDKPHERVIGENYSENLRAALDQAMSADAYPPARPEYDFCEGALHNGNRARRRAEALGIDYDAAMAKGRAQ